MAKSKYTPFEQNDIKLSKWLVDCDAKLAAVQASLAGAEKTHRVPLRKLFKELTQAHTKKTESLAQNTYDLEWEVNILRPLTLHLNDVGQAWTNQHYCKEALDYFVQLAKIGDDMVKLYSQNAPIEKMKERVEAFMDAAPMTLGMAEEPSPYYPLMTKRRDVSELLWQEILSELSPQKNKTYYYDGVYGFTGYLDMYRSLALGVAAVLDGNKEKMSAAQEGEGLSNTEQMKALNKFLDHIEYNDDYKEDRKAKRAFLQARKLQQTTATPVSAKPKTRRL